jgi:small subunit ribosomal protein S3
MGQKAIPIGLRLGLNRGWHSKWFSGKNEYAECLRIDLNLRKFVKGFLKSASVSKIQIEKTSNEFSVVIYTSRPGVIIGKKGAGIASLSAAVLKKFSIKASFNIVEIRKPDLYAQIVADDIAEQMVRRVSYKRAMKRAMSGVMKSGAKGVKILCSGRLAGAEIARKEKQMDGSVPLHTFRADVDYGEGVAHTTYGACGVKVWIYRECNASARERKLGDLASGSSSS